MSSSARATWEVEGTVAVAANLMTVSSVRYGMYCTADTINDAVTPVVERNVGITHVWQSFKKFPKIPSCALTKGSKSSKKLSVRVSFSLH